MSLARRYSRIAEAVFGYEDEQLVHEVTRPDGAGDDLLVARGDTLVDNHPTILRSQLPDVSDEAWTQFVRGLAVAKPNHVSESNALGIFEIMPRRLADLGLVGNLKRRKHGRKTIWVAVFVPPLTPEKFLRSPELQYRTFVRSMRDYDQRMQSGDIPAAPGVSRAGALAILHRAGPYGLRNWTEGDRFETTERIYDQVAGIF